jgi:TPR repeat protein
MNTLRLIFLGVLLTAMLPASSHGQYYNGRRYINRRGFPAQQVPQRQFPATNAAPAQPDPATMAPTPAPQPTPQVATNFVVRTQVVVRVAPPPVDPEKARAAKEEATRRTVEFQKKRASEGSESAQYELGMRYLRGDGVEKDEATGRKWLTQAAENGYGPAAKKLEDLDKPAKPGKEEK